MVARMNKANARVSAMIGRKPYHLDYFAAGSDRCVEESMVLPPVVGRHELSISDKCLRASLTFGGGWLRTTSSHQEVFFEVQGFVVLASFLWISWCNYIWFIRFILLNIFLLFYHLLFCPLSLSLSLSLFLSLFHSFSLSLFFTLSPSLSSTTYERHEPSCSSANWNVLSVTFMMGNEISSDKLVLNRSFPFSRRDFSVQRLKRSIDLSIYP